MGTGGSCPVGKAAGVSICPLASIQCRD